ncbi:MAG: AzlD domain-containing protein [Pseudorhodoplanes sp.]
MTATLSDLNPYLALILVGFLPNEIWRWLGVVFSRGLDEGSEVLVWVRAVATAILAGVVAQLIFLPPGALAAVPLAVRLGATVAGFASFLLIRRSVFAGVVAGELALIAGALAFVPG